MIIYIIEDEYLALEELLQVLEPYMSEHKVLGFKNGEDALQHARRETPDIIISDIRMPGLSGLETLRRLAELNPRVQAAMLSGFGDFEYARTALKLGAKEYVLKPAKDSELFAVLDRLIGEAEKEALEARMAVDWSFTRRIRGLADKGDTTSEAQLAGKWIMLGLLNVNWKSASTWTTNGLAPSAASEWLTAHVHPSAKCFDLDGHLRIVLLPVSHADKDDFIRQRALRVHDHMQAGVRIVHTAYVKTEQQSLETAYQQLQQLLESQVRLGISTFMLLDHPPSLLPMWENARMIEKHVANAEYAKLGLELRRLLDNFRRSAVTMKQVSEFLSDFMYAVKYNLNRSKPEAESLSQDSIYEYLKTCDDYVALHDWLLDKLSRVMPVPGTETSQPKQIIPSIMEYVKQYYDQTIHLQDFATKHHVSIGHLSKLFKAETGTNFSDYIIQVRMAKAQELIAGGYKKISEISKLVGYEDPKFFSQTFKKWLGVTPQDYKNKEK